MLESNRKLNEIFMFSQFAIAARRKNFGIKLNENISLKNITTKNINLLNMRLPLIKMNLSVIETQLFIILKIN